MEYVVICDQTEGGHTGYGLMVWDETGLRMCRDLCSSTGPVLDLARRCNVGQLSPEHFREVVEDFLAAW